MYKKLQLKQFNILVVSLALILQTSAIFSQTQEEKGFEIAARNDRSDRGFSDSRVELNMLLRNAAGNETTRQLRIETLEIPDEEKGDRSLIIFKSPADIDGTALLSHAKILIPDDQWLFMPALKRIKRISSVNKSGPFVGSEFAFEDLTAQELNKYNYKYIRSEACGKLQCDVVERYPRYEYSGYTKHIAWIDQKDFQIRKVEFYDRRGSILKTLKMENYRLYSSGFWRSHLFSMENHQTGKQTTLTFKDYQFNVGAGNNDFTPTRLKRIR